MLLKNCTFPTTYPKKHLQKLLRRPRLCRLYLPHPQLVIPCLSFFYFWPSSASFLVLVFPLLTLANTHLVLLFQCIHVALAKWATHLLQLYILYGLGTCNDWIAVQQGQALACHCISSTQAFSRAVTPNETIEVLGILCGTTQTSSKEIFAGQAHVDRL